EPAPARDPKPAVFEAPVKPPEPAVKPPEPAAKPPEPAVKPPQPAPEVKFPVTPVPPAPPPPLPPIDERKRVPDARASAKEVFVDLPERNQGGTLMGGVDPDALPADTKPAEKGKEYTPKNKQFTINMPADVPNIERSRVLPVRGRAMPLEMSQSTL